MLPEKALLRAKPLVAALAIIALAAVPAVAAPAGPVASDGPGWSWLEMVVDWVASIDQAIDDVAAAWAAAIEPPVPVGPFDGTEGGGMMDPNG